MLNTCKAVNFWRICDKFKHRHLQYQFMYVITKMLKPFTHNYNKVWQMQRGNNHTWIHFFNEYIMASYHERKVTKSKCRFNVFRWIYRNELKELLFINLNRNKNSWINTTELKMQIKYGIDEISIDITLQLHWEFFVLLCSNPMFSLLHWYVGLFRVVWYCLRYRYRSPFVLFN